MKKVFILNKGFHCYEDAKNYGELVFLSAGRLNRYAYGEMLRIFQEAFEDSTPEDIILISSLSIASALACSLFTHIHERLNILVYDSTKEKYHYFPIHFPQKTGVIA